MLAARYYWHYVHMRGQPQYQYRLILRLRMATVKYS